MCLKFRPIVEAASARVSCSEHGSIYTRALTILFRTYDEGSRNFLSNPRLLIHLNFPALLCVAAKRALRDEYASLERDCNPLSSDFFFRLIRDRFSHVTRARSSRENKNHCRARAHRAQESEIARYSDSYFDEGTRGGRRLSARAGKKKETREGQWDIRP